MKTLLISLAAVCIAHAHPVLLNDDFNGDTLDPAVWQTFTPYSDTTVTMAFGATNLLNGGGILSIASYQTPIEVLFSFAFDGDYDSFRLYTRVDDFRDDGYHVKHGIGASFRIQEDTGNLIGNVALEDSSGTLATGTFALTGNTAYTARLVDNGTSIGLYWGGELNPFLTANASEHYGDKIAAWNRHGEGAGSYISAGSHMGLDYITVLDLNGAQDVDEHGITALYMGLGLMGLVMARK